MRERARQQGGPGTLTDDLAVSDSSAQDTAAEAASGESLAELAAKYKLRPSAARPGVFAYAAQLWERRHFIMGFATARNVAMYTEARLGQLWQVLTPLLNAAVYYLIFGKILDTSRGVPNFIAFLITGIFIWNFTQRSFITASRVMPDSLPLIRALPFPRGCLPIGYVLIELQQLAMSMIILIAIVLGTREPLTWYWLLAIPALALQAVFNTGMALFLARLGAGADDFGQLMPFLVRTWMYASGVMFSIQTVSSLRNHPTLTYLLQINPAAVYISLVRNAILSSQRAAWPGSKPYNADLCHLYHTATKGKALLDSAYCHGAVSMNGLWLWGAGWAVLAMVVGFVFFWQAETRYGRG
ncbi:MAG: ABC transporter permease [Streptosporangiaceae bacterium]|nr:ABC transporter permease [Streptosporangiaceae bacterium]